MLDAITTGIRRWTDEKGWIHEVQKNGQPHASSKHRDELQTLFPTAIGTRKVICGDNNYEESSNS